MRLPGAVRATGVGPQLQGVASGVCETPGSHRAVAGGLGKGVAGKSATQRATQIAAGEFPVAVGCHGAIELTLQLSQVNAVAGQFMKVAVQPIPLLGIVVIWTNLPEIRAFLRTGEALQYASEQGAN